MTYYTKRDKENDKYMYKMIGTTLMVCFSITFWVLSFMLSSQELVNRSLIYGTICTIVSVPMIISTYKYSKKIKN